MRSKLFPAAIGLIAAMWIGMFALVKWMQLRDGTGLSAEVVADRLPRSPTGTVLPILWDVPAFSYLDQNRHAVTNQDLRGQVWISDFFFTSCTSICPMMTAKMAQLQKTITNSKVQFVSFSVDPDHDTPEMLKAYANMWRADELRWHFLSTDRVGLAETAAGMKTFVQPPDKETPIQHSGIFILADGDGKVRGVYDSSDSIALQRLAFDAMALAGTPPATMPAIAAAWGMPTGSRATHSPGEALYLSRGCVACHAQQKVAPPLQGRFGQKIRLEDGSSIIADEGYLRESILDPNAKIVAGYPHLMPSYRGQLTDEEVGQLVEYLKSIGGPSGRELLVAASQPAASRSAVDPVCKMEVNASDHTLHASYDGKTYLFCSTTCRDQFLKNPSRFAGSPSTSQPNVTQP